MSPRRITMERAWIGVSVLYGLFRAYLVWEFLGEYHVNALVFLIIELTSSALYGLWSGRLLGALIDSDRRAAWRVGPKAMAAYLAPDAYVLASAGRLPGPVLEIIIGIVLVTATLTGIGLWLRVRNARRLAGAPGSGPSTGE
jgi:hypothetical protein